VRDCNPSPDGRGYVGNVAQTSNGRACQPWSSQFPHGHDYNVSSVFHADGSIAVAADYCRNPDVVFNQGPWCYTKNGSSVLEVPGATPSVLEVPGATPRILQCVGNSARCLPVVSNLLIIYAVYHVLHLVNHTHTDARKVQHLSVCGMPRIFKLIRQGAVLTREACTFRPEV